MCKHLLYVRLTSTNQFVYRPNGQTCLANKFRQQIVLGRKYFCFQTKNVFEQNVSKTQNILLKQGNKSRIITYPDRKSYVRKFVRGG